MVCAAKDRFLRVYGYGACGMERGVINHSRTHSLNQSFICMSECEGQDEGKGKRQIFLVNEVFEGVCVLLLLLLW